MAMQKHMSFLILVYALLSFLSNLKFGCGSTVGGYGYKSCVESEKQALLLFKESLVDDLSYLSSWVGDDCCAWLGIGCNNRTGNVNRLDIRNGLLKGDHLYPSLLDLKYLTYLDLSNNNFTEMKIPQFFGSFKDLTYLNLSYTNFEGFVPHHLGNLSSLQYLDLNGFNFNFDYNNFDLISSLLSIDSMRWLSGLSMLKHLDLSFVNLSRATDWFSSINMLSNSISVLKLQTCQLPNNIPHHLPLINLTSLVSLDLGYNQLNSSFPLWVLNNSGLSHLYLGSNNFDGLIPDSIGTLTALSGLQLYGNNFEGSIPEAIGYLTSLTDLDFASNNFQGLIPQSIGNLTSLDQLRFSSNELKGGLTEEVCRLSKLESLDVDENQLSGSIPECIGELSNLRILFLGSNSWEGYVTERHFVNLAMLTDLYVSSKSNLALNVSNNWVPPFQLQFILMDSLKVGPKFPSWLLTQRQIGDIRMKNTSLSTIPAEWFASLLSQAQRVHLSNNDINGELSSISAVPNGLGRLALLALSNNRFSGGFPSFLCNATSLFALIISNNNFSGELPHCLGNLTKLTYFDVMNNRFTGDIPISLGSLVALTYLNLHENKFQGKLPMSFQNLKELVTLDVGKNNLIDILPPWSGEQLPQLKYLILRSNNFFGEIPTQLCHYSSIQILNLAQNKIRGSIPPCFGNFSAMIRGDNNDLFPGFQPFYDEMVIDDMKGYELEYTTTLGFAYSIDLSNNNISGEIPQELMDLHGLKSLNLAGNHLTGRIPDKIGNLKSLEFLNLSRNELYGHIPKSLSDLYSLSQLDLSFNDLSGRIPTGKQLQTLEDPSIYAGNNHLCGQPILKPCVGDNNEGDSYSDDDRVWFYAGIGPGLLVGFLGFCASLHFVESWRYFYFHLIDQVFYKIAASFALLRRKFQN